MYLLFLFIEQEFYHKQKFTRKKFWLSSWPLSVTDCAWFNTAEIQTISNIRQYCNENVKTTEYYTFGNLKT